MLKSVVAIAEKLDEYFTALLDDDASGDTRGLLGKIFQSAYLHN